MSSHPPPRYTSRGGYHEVVGYDDSTIFPMPQDSTSQQQEHDHYHYQQEQQYMLDKLSQEAQLQQKIAEGMLTPRANNNHNTTAMDDDDVLFGMDDVPITFMNPKPWESTNSNHDGGQYGAQFPAMGPFPTNDVMNDIDMPTEQPPAVATAVATTTHHPTNYNNHNNGGPSSTKSVTFKTHDEFHSWDEQLDQLLHVDEEFFNVAHYLLEVVNVGSVLNFDDDNFDDDEDVGGYFDNGGQSAAATAVALTPVNDGIDCNSGGILARFFTFAQCGTVNDVDYNEYGRQEGPSHHMNSNNSVGGGEKKKYKLTKKLVQDFEQALKFRMENIDSSESLLVGGGMESEVVTRTKQIADKVEAYGLPGMPPSQDRIPGQQQQPYEERYGSEHVAENNGSAAYGDCYEVDCDEVEEEFMRTLQASKMERRKQPRHFPILPTDDDEDVKGRGGMNEDERRFYNTFGNISTTIKESTQRQQQRNCNSQSPFKSVCKLFSTLVGPKTSTPSKEECQIRLQQIQREISNADKMMESSTSKEVIAACANRIKKLRDEERMYQIFKEISKIQAMMQATESGSVKNACGQRLYQLSAELNSIDLGQYDDELDVNDEDEVEVEITVPMAKAPVAKAIGGDDLDWYERAQRYVRTQEPQDPVMSSNQHTIAANGHYRPPHMQQYPQQYPQQYSHQYPPHPSYIPDDENYYDRHYPAKQQFASPSPPRRVLSPRNGRPFPHPPY